MKTGQLTLHRHNIIAWYTGFIQGNIHECVAAKKPRITAQYWQCFCSVDEGISDFTGLSILVNYNLLLDNNLGTMRWQTTALKLYISSV